MSLLDKLPKIVEQGRRTAEQILESLEGKQRISLQTRELVFPARDSLIQDIFSTTKDLSAKPSQLIYGDNLLALSALIAGDSVSGSLRNKVDLIYIDPPFDSKADYRTKVTLPSCDIEQKPTVIEQYAYGDTWREGTSSYIAMLVPRLILMRELLSERGSIFVHLDWHVGHYVKIVLDEIFGKENFRNEIIWHYSGWNKKLKNSFEKRHDSIFFYGKTSDQYFESYFEKWDSKEEYVKKRKQKVLKEEDGKEYVLSDAGNGQRIKRYLDDVMREGVVIDDVWHMDKLNNSAKESVGYATQKTEELLERIILAASPEGGLVADFFAGSGTTAAVSERLGRKWIVSDLGKPACMVMRKRLIDLNASPFLYQAIGDYQVESVRSTLGKRFSMGELARIVVELYGAIPLPQESNPNKDRGSVGKTLVICDSPNKITGLPTLKKAQALRDQLMDGWDKVVILGWNFASDIGYSLAQLADSRLEVLVIPPDLMDRLRKKGSFEKLKDSIRFSSLQYLTVKEPKIVKGSKDSIEIELENYVLLSPDAINLDEENRKALQKVMNNDPLSLIEYWAVDTNYDGEIFRSTWQDYRGNTEKDDDELHVVRKATLNIDGVSGARKICVRAVDVFGFESEVILEV